jgi:hypothetical protein
MVEADQVIEVSIQARSLRLLVHGVNSDTPELHRPSYFMMQTLAPANGSLPQELQILGSTNDWLVRSPV